MKKVIKPSKNVEDDRSSNTGKSDRLKSSLSAARDAANIALRSYYSNTGQSSQAQKKNASRLGVDQSVTDLQNTGNKLKAASRTRMNNIDSPPLEYLIKRKVRR